MKSFLKKTINSTYEGRIDTAEEFSLGLDYAQVYVSSMFILVPTPFTPVENIVRKGEIACNKQFLLFSQCFLPYMLVIFHFECTLKCSLQFV